MVRDDRNTEVFDVFYYPSMAESVRCPAHIDPGLVTLLVTDQDGLEVQEKQNWLPLGTSFPEAASLAGVAFSLVGAEWAYAAPFCVNCPKCQPCMHRVKVKENECRVSAALEFRLAAKSRERLAQSLHRLTSTSSSSKGGRPSKVMATANLVPRFCCVAVFAVCVFFFVFSGLCPLKPISRIKMSQAMQEVIILISKA